MPSSEQPVELAQYRVLLYLKRSRTILAEWQGNSLRLPRISIPTCARPAEKLTRALRDKLGFRSVVIDYLPLSPGSDPKAVVEVLNDELNGLHNGMVSVVPEEISDADLTQTERHILRDIMSGTTDGRGPFSRIGWIKEALKWIRESVVDHSVEFTDQIQQLNATSSFALVRFGTRSGPAYWLKATGEPNRHEYAVTTFLVERYPAYLPPLVASRQDWNAWVMEDAGIPLRQSISLQNCERTIARLGYLHRETVGCMDSVPRGIVPQLDITSLERSLDAMFKYIEIAMDDQESTKAPRITSSRLQKLRDTVAMACVAMRALEIPDTIVHRDINPGNVLIGDKVVFIDWAEAAVGNPIINCAQFFAHLARYGEVVQGWKSQLTTAYKQAWKGLLTREQFQEAFRLAPMLAIAFCLHGDGAWLRSSGHYLPGLQSYRRSLARYLDRAAMSLEDARVQC